MSSIDTVKRRLQKQYKAQKSTGAGGWREVGMANGITGSMAYRIAMEESYEPHDAVIRQSLGLVVLAPAPVCEHCGKVHVSRRCPSRRIYKDLWDIPASILRRMLEERYELSNVPQQTRPEISSSETG